MTNQRDQNIATRKLPEEFRRKELEENEVNWRLDAKTEEKIDAIEANLRRTEQISASILVR